MKKFRKLIPALCMLLISAVLLGTSTFAWFSMNTTVTATGMQVTAKTDHTYLLISDTNDKDALQENPDTNDTKVDFKMTAVSLAPSAHEGFTTSADAAKTDKWFTAQGSDPTKKDIDETTKQTFTKLGVNLDNDKNGYVLKKTVYITVTSESKEAKNLKVSEVKIAKDDNSKVITPLRVLVVCGDNHVEFDSTGAVIGTDSVLAETISSTADLTKVDIYIYYNGDDSTVYTNNSTNLGGASVELTFSVDQ